MAFQSLNTCYLGLATAVGGSFYPTEQTGLGYSRIAVTPQYDPFYGMLALQAGVTFAASGTWAASTYAVLYDSATGGNPLLTWQIPSFTLVSGGTQSYAPNVFNSVLNKFTSGLAVVGGQAVGAVINAAGTVLPSTVYNPVGLTYTSTSGVAGTMVATGQIYNPGSQPPVNFRNLLDGADFTVNPWQRGTSFTVSGSIAITYTADRWFVKCSNSAGGLTVTRSAITNVAGYSQALKVARTSANTNTNVFNIGHVLESSDVVRTRGQLLTLSFIATAGANYSGGAITIQILSGTTADEGAATSISGYTGATTLLSTTFTPTTTPATFAFTSSALVPAGCNELAVVFGVTPTGTAGSDDSVSFPIIQLEPSTQASPFERRDVQVELEICQRYAWYTTEPAANVIIGAGFNPTAATQVFYMATPVQMRAAPTVTVLAGAFKTNQAGTPTACTITPGTTHTPNAISINGNSAGTAGQGTVLQGGGGSGFILASADL